MIGGSIEFTLKTAGRHRVTDKPTFLPKMNKNGSWFVSVTTGHGPDSHIGDFLTEKDARHWISTKSLYWPGKPDAPK
jgi:hypothetical protein